MAEIARITGKTFVDTITEYMLGTKDVNFVPFPEPSGVGSTGIDYGSYYGKIQQDAINAHHLFIGILDSKFKTSYSGETR